MYKYDKKKTGEYLRHKINQEYKSIRKFGGEYLKLRGCEVDDVSLQNMSNHLSQILNGNNSIPNEDLPYFSELLKISCEEILSAGECSVANLTHLTNYVIASSKDKEAWQQYIEQKKGWILNTDEYDKTIVDYALEFKNYELLKCLINNVDSFVEANLNKYFKDYGISDAEMKEKYELRAQMIILAIKQDDIKMLEKLHAREIPTFYLEGPLCLGGHLIKSKKYYDKNLIKNLVNASDKVLDYFFEEIKIRDKWRTYKFLFPFTGELVNLLIEYKNHHVKKLLKDVVAHNQYALEKLNSLLKTTACCYKEEPERAKRVMKERIQFYDDDTIVSYFDSDTKEGMITNIFKINQTTNDYNISCLINECNHIYSSIDTIVDDFVKEKGLTKKIGV